MTPHEQKNKAKDLAKEFSTSARGLLPSSDGSKFFRAGVFEKGLNTLRFEELHFQSQLKQALSKGLSFQDAVEKACMDAEVTHEWAKKYMASSRYKRWLTDRIKEFNANNELSAEYVASMHLKNIEGKIELKPGQLESLREIGERLWPKVSKVEHRIEQIDATSMDDLLKVRDEVSELEAKFKKAIETTAKEVPHE